MLVTQIISGNSITVSVGGTPVILVDVSDEDMKKTATCARYAAVVNNFHQSGCPLVYLLFDNTDSAVIVAWEAYLAVFFKLSLDSKKSFSIVKKEELNITVLSILTWD